MMLPWNKPREAQDGSFGASYRTSFWRANFFLRPAVFLNYQLRRFGLIADVWYSPDIELMSYEQHKWQTSARRKANAEWARQRAQSDEIDRQVRRR